MKTTHRIIDISSFEEVTRISKLGSAFYRTLARKGSQKSKRPTNLPGAMACLYPTKVVAVNRRQGKQLIFLDLFILGLRHRSNRVSSFWFGFWETGRGRGILLWWLLSPWAAWWHVDVEISAIKGWDLRKGCDPN